MFTIKSLKKNKITIFLFLIIFLFLLSYIFFIIKHFKKINYNYDNFIINKISKNRERYIVKNFLNEEDINFLIKINIDYGAKQNGHIEVQSSYIKDNQKKKKFIEIENNIRNMINYISKKNDVVDHNITVQTGKSGHRPHADNTREVNGVWVPNHTPERTWTSGLLLIDKKKIKGGLFKFHNPNQTVDFNKGDLLVFKSDHSNVHEVTKIDDGKRYVHLTWLKENNFKNYIKRNLGEFIKWIKG